MDDLTVFDSSILIDQIRTNRYLDQLLNVNGIVRNSSVVLAELWLGAYSTVDRKTVETLAHPHPILTPTANNWLDSGQLLAKMQKDKGFEPHKLRDLHFDVLIALTARTHGALLITSNRADFEMIRTYKDFQLEVW